MSTAPHPLHYHVDALSLAHELISLGERSCDEGRRCDTYFTLAGAIIDAVDANDSDLARQWIDGAIAWLGRAS